MLPEAAHTLVKQIELKDGCTAAHTWRVVLYTRAMAEHFDCPADLIARLTMGAALHDLGKIDVPDEILKKPGPLTVSERSLMERHAELGHKRLMDDHESDPLVLGLVRSHHERIDGSGYPDRLLGDSIPPAARYFAVIDSFDAMTSVRPYRSTVGAKAAERALEELGRDRGTRYCSESVDAMEMMFRRGTLSWILEYFNDTSDVPCFGASGTEALLCRGANRC